MRCQMCGEPFSSRGMPIHLAMRHGIRSEKARKPPRRLDLDRLWFVLSGMGVIENGTWVSFCREDAEYIAREYAVADVEANP